ncbi:MAG: exodeoxyribonuclease V subunit beta [Planctomycetota bacterium]
MTATAFDLRRGKLPKGTMLLEASAGTGKTYTITGIVLRMLLEGIVESLPQVLVVTFTVAATEELKTRLRRALAQGIAACEGAPTDDPFLQHLAAAHGQDGARTLRKALAQADEMSVATIHGFCRRVLEESAFESALPFASDFVDDEVPLLAEAARDAVRLEVLSRSPVAGAIAVAGKLLPDDLLPQYRQLRRHPDTALQPPPGEWTTALAEVAALIERARALAADDDLPVAELRRLAFRKDANSPLEHAGAALPDELRTRLADGDDPCLDWLLALEPERLHKALLKKNAPSLDHPLFALCGALAEANARAAHALRHRLFTAMDLRLMRHKRTANCLTFTDLLDEVARTLRDPKLGKPLLQSIRARWQAALIDEFQDTDPRQYEVFATCFGDRRLLLVGDPKQSIYGFRGADVHSYLGARKDARRTHTLGENFRSHPDLVAAVELLFDGPAAFAHAGIELPEVAPALSAEALALLGDDGPALQLRWLPPGSKEGKVTLHNRDYAEERAVVDVADECVRLLGGGVRVPLADGGERPLQARDLAVLTRTNAQAVAIQDELRRRAVHSAIGKAGDVFKCAEMDDVQRLLTALCNPTWLPVLRAAWTTPLFGLDGDDLRALDADEDELARQLAQADGWRRTWFRHGFVVMFQDLLDRLDVRRRLLQRADGERKLTNYLQIAELLHHAEVGRQLAPESLVQWLSHERRHADEIDYELRELRLESDADAVQILTVHGSKGLQYEVVFVPFAWVGRDAPPPPRLVRTDAGHVLDYRPDGDSGEVFDRDNLAEDLRLLYVALTRARRRCYLYWGALNGGQRAALTYLLAGPGRTADDAAQVPPPDVWAAQLKDDHAEWRRHAAALAAISDGAIGVSDMPAVAPPEPRPVLTGAAERGVGRARPLPAHLPPGFRIGSFTALLANDHAAPLPELPAAQLDEPAEPADADGVEAPAVGMFAFARGAAAGVCLHEILERVDFAAAAVPGEDAGTDALVRQVLQRHGLAEPAAHPAPLDPAPVVTAMVRALAALRPPALPFRLADLTRAAMQAEWQFFLRAGGAAPRALGALFRRHAPAHLGGYGDALERLPRPALNGYLRGFVDLVAEHAGRYWVFDWKSNWLGAEPDRYGDDRLLADVQRHHYVLQYHLYLLALHRHLRARLPDYDYDRCVGGACYVYLRAVGAPGAAAGAGVFVDRPDRAMIEALDRWLEGEVAP